MKKIRLMPAIGLLAATLAYIIMVVCTMLCGRFIAGAVSVPDTDPPADVIPDETTLSPESGITTEPCVSDTVKVTTETVTEETETDPPETETDIVYEETTSSPEVTTELPTVTTGSPVVTTEPSVVTTTPPAVTTTPPLVTTKPPAVTASPLPVTTEPPVTTQSPNNNDKEPREVLNYTDMKAMWISQFDMSNVYCSGGVQRNKSQYIQLVEKMLDNVKMNGFNTVILQMRPYADSMYQSEFYPTSRFVTGAYGRNVSYDPVEIFIELAHERDLSIHAWINPMRGMLVNEVASVSNKYKIKQWYTDSEYKGKYVVTVDNRLYLNPAYEEVRNLIVDGAKEILEKYSVDGLHMDDYFYPTQDASFDLSAYKAHKASGGKLALKAYRMNNLNLLISALYDAVKSENADLLFGISPAGVITNVTDKQYADVHTWCANEGYIDYICPQVYFGLEHQNYDFVKVCNTWQSIIKVDSIDLVIGMTLGKAKSKVDSYAGTGKNEWAEHRDILKRCLEYTDELDKCVGVSYFCYQYFYDPLSGASVTDTLEERNNFIPLFKEISWAD